MNETINNLISRRSCKSFNNKQVDDEILNQILEAGKYTACGKGAQSSCVVVIKNKEIVKKLSSLNASILNNLNIDPFYGATTVIIVFANKNISTYIEDGSLVMGNLMNAAYSLGVDSCWIHRAREMFETSLGKEFKEKWGLGDEYVGIANCILGYRSSSLLKAKERRKDFVKYIEE